MMEEETEPTKISIVFIITIMICIIIIITYLIYYADKKRLHVGQTKCHV